jgi:SanA protein
MTITRNLARFALLLIFVAVLFTAVTNLWVIVSTYSNIYTSSEEIPAKSVGLVLGTTHRLSNGEENPYFTGRIKSAAKLYHQNKISHIILSGDNGTIYYNEPLKMKEALLKEGVPNDAITLDYAGFRTLDSVVRCYEIFGQSKFTIITQRFHGYRALFISKFYNLDAVVLTAGDMSFPAAIFTRLREVMARPLAVIDLYIIKRQPHILGKKEYI